MKLNKKCLLYIVGILSLINYSCGDLSRSKAKELLLKDKNFKSKIYIGDLSKPACVEEFAFKWNSGRPTYNDDWNNVIKLLIQKDYFKLTKLSRSMCGDWGEVECIIPANKTLPYLYEDSGNEGFLCLAEKSDIIVTGITGTNDRKTVKFDIIYSLNAIGREVNYPKELIVHDSEVFIKYDDGWR